MTQYGIILKTLKMVIKKNGISLKGFMGGMLLARDYDISVLYLLALGSQTISLIRNRALVRTIG